MGFVGQSRLRQFLFELIKLENNTVLKGTNDNDKVTQDQLDDKYKVVYPVEGTAGKMFHNANYASKLTAPAATKFVYNYTMDKLDLFLPLAKSQLDDLNVNMLGSTMRFSGRDLANFMVSKTLQKWIPTVSGRIISTTGALRNTFASNNPNIPSQQAGQRKAATYDDIVQMQMLAMAEGLGDDNGLYALITPSIFADLLTIPEFDAAVLKGHPEAGVIAQWRGFKFMVRNTVALFDAAGAVLPTYTIDTNTANNPISRYTPQATDNYGAIFYHKDYVQYAQGNPTKGGIEIIENANIAGYGGASEIDMKIWHGGNITDQANNTGVWALRETT